MAAVVVIGVGNELRGDDGAGPAVAGLVANGSAPVLRSDGGPGLLDLWHGARAAVLVDAVITGAPAGTIHRLDASTAPLPRSVAASGTHAVGLSETIELARALHRLPARVIVYGVEAASFALGAPMSAAVSAALVPVARRVADEVAALD